MFRKLFQTIALLTPLTAISLSAEELPMPAGTIILTVTGQITATNAGDAAHFDLEMLRSFDATTIETSTIWTEGTQTFEGVSLAALNRALGMDGETLRATAVNDYAVDIPITDAIDGGPIVAYHRNGQPMSLREKGPLWIIYPYDSGAQYRTEVIYARSIWQLDRIDVLE